MNLLFQRMVCCCMTIVFACHGMGNAQAPLMWNSTYSRNTLTGDGTHLTMDMATTDGGSVIAVGSTDPQPGNNYSDAAIIKWNPSGSIVGKLEIDYWGINAFDRAVKVIVRGADVYVLIHAKYQILGVTALEGDMVVYHLDTALNVLQSALLPTPVGFDEVPVDMGLDASGNVYITGSTDKGTGTFNGQDIVLARFSANLVHGYTRYNSSGGQFMDNPLDMEVTPAGDCLITGFKVNPTRGSQVCVLRYNAAGVKQWDTNWDYNKLFDFEDKGRAIAWDPLTNAVFVTGAAGTSPTDRDMVLLKFKGSTGALEWSRKFGSSAGLEDGLKVSYTGSGSLYVAGTIYTSLSGVISSNINLRKVNPATGNTFWSKTFGGNANLDDSFYDMVVSPGDNVYIGGWQLDNASGSLKVKRYVRSYNPNGTLIWNALMTHLAGAPQDISGVRLAYNNNTASLFAIHTELTTFSFANQWKLTKYGPAFIQNDDNEISRIFDESIPSLLQLFPNPATSFVRLLHTGNDKEPYQLQVMDMTGKLWLSMNEAVLPFDLSVESLPAGVYVVQLVNADESISLKFIKQ